jgi:hypothetical protein
MDDAEAADATAAQLAYRAIALYIEHTQIAGLLVARLASEVGEARLKPIAESGLWQSYMAVAAEARNDSTDCFQARESQRLRTGTKGCLKNQSSEEQMRQPRIPKGCRGQPGASEAALEYPGKQRAPWKGARPLTTKTNR